MPPLGCNIRYLPSSGREVEKRETIDPSLRDGLFMGHRLHTGGKWTDQHQVIDSEAFAQIQEGTGRTAYVHAVSEIYVPGSAGDDREKHPTFPVAEGLLAETTVSPSDEESAGELIVETVADLTTDLAETLLSLRGTTTTKTPMLTTRGVGDEEANTADQAESGQKSPDQDFWLTEGDFPVRRHILPRTILFSPLDVPLGPPPIDVKHIEVLRYT